MLKKVLIGIVLLSLYLLAFRLVGEAIDVEFKFEDAIINSYK
jgi:hypothetical protein